MPEVFARGAEPAAATPRHTSQVGFRDEQQIGGRLSSRLPKLLIKGV